MENTRKRPAADLPLLAVLALSLGFLLFFGFQKQGYHPDEELTYQLSNSYYEPWMTWYQPEYTAQQWVQGYLLGDTLGGTLGKWGDLVRDIAQNGLRGSGFYQDYKRLSAQAEQADEPVWHTADYFEDTFTVSAEQGFSPGSVYYNQAADTHPPLYYLLVNLVSSLFPGQFSKWFALSVNYAAMLALLVVFYRILRRWFGGRRMALFLTLAYGISMPAMWTAQFLRMYTLLTLFTTAFWGLCLELLLSQGQRTTVRWRAAFFGVILLGFYSQYYFCIFAVAASALVLPVLALQRRWRAAGSYLLWAGLAFAASLAIWPFSIKHIFFGARGTGAFENIRSGAYAQTLKEFFTTLLEPFFGGSLPLALLFGALLLAAAVLLLCRPAGPEKTGSLLRYGLTAVILVLYFPVVALVSPFPAVRYGVCLFPLAFVLLWKAAQRVLDALMARLPALPRGALPAALCLLLALTEVSALYGAWPDSYPNQELRMETARQNAGATCLYYCSDDLDWTWASAAPDMRHYQRTAMVQQSKADWIGQNLTVAQGDVLMVYISNILDQSEALAALWEQLGAQPVTLEQLPQDSDFYAYVYRMTF